MLISTAMTTMRQCLPRQAVTHGFATVLRKTHVLGLGDKLLCVLCWTAQALVRRMCWRHFRCHEIVNQRVSLVATKFYRKLSSDMRKSSQFVKNHLHCHYHCHCHMLPGQQAHQHQHLHCWCHFDAASCLAVNHSVQHHLLSFLLAPQAEVLWA